MGRVTVAAAGETPAGSEGTAADRGTPTEPALDTATDETATGDSTMARIQWIDGELAHKRFMLGMVQTRAAANGIQAQLAQLKAERARLVEG